MRRLLFRYIAKELRQAIRESGQPPSQTIISLLADDRPRSLSGCDSFLLPQILKDFPDFDVTVAESYIKKHLKQHFAMLTDFKIHNIVIARYLPSRLQKTIVFQVAACHRQNSSVIQTRYDLDYTYLLPDATSTVAANCPNCGGALEYGDTSCSFCGSMVTAPLGSSWRVTDIRET